MVSETTSSSSYYYRNNGNEGIPFQWESQPGTPKNPPRDDEIPRPLSPPPAMLSLSLPKPCIGDEPSIAKPLSKMRLLMLCIKSKNVLQLNNKKSCFQANNNTKDHQNHVVVVDGVSNGDTTDESAFESSNSRSSSSSSSSLSSGSPSPVWHVPNRSTMSCSPKKLRSIFSLALQKGFKNKR